MVQFAFAIIYILRKFQLQIHKYLNSKHFQKIGLLIRIYPLYGNTCHVNQKCLNNCINLHNNYIIIMLHYSMRKRGLCTQYSYYSTPLLFKVNF